MCTYQWIGTRCQNILLSTLLLVTLSCEGAAPFKGSDAWQGRASLVGEQSASLSLAVSESITLIKHETKGIQWQCFMTKRWLQISGSSEFLEPWSRLNIPRPHANVHSAIPCFTKRLHGSCL